MYKTLIKPSVLQNGCKVWSLAIKYVQSWRSLNDTAAVIKNIIWTNQNHLRRTEEHYGVEMA